MGEIYSLWLYRISIVTSLIICEEVESFKIKRFLALRERTGERSGAKPPARHVSAEP
jgi:hypothetical protein